MKNMFAFTLAEVLIILGIIGVVAAITIPGLLTNYKAIQLHSKFKKNYSLLAQTLKIAQEDGIIFNDVAYGSSDRYEQVNAFKKYLVGVVDCEISKNRNLKACLRITYGLSENFKDGYKTLSSNSPDLTNQGLFDDGQILLQDGTLVFFNVDGQMLGLSVDINGVMSPPNRWGYDLFTFQIKNENLIPMGSNGSKYIDKDVYCSLDSESNFNGIACASMATDLDYFKWVVKALK